MYTNDLFVDVISGSRETENIMRRVAVPQDTLLHIRTTENTDSVRVRNGAAVVYDCRSDFSLFVKKECYTAVIMTASNISEEIVRTADDVWLVPDGKLNEALIESYFNRMLTGLKESADARRLKICFETAIDSIPDLVWFKDRKGAHLIVNNAFCRAVEKTKEQIYKKGHYYIWDIPKEEYEQGDYVCLESEDMVIDARKTMLFDENVKTKKGMRLFKTYKSPLIDNDGSIFGTCGIAHDVTDLGNINSELEIILKSIPYGIVIEDMNSTVVSVNPEFKSYYRQDVTGQNFDEWKKEHLGNSYDTLSQDIKLDSQGECKYLVFGERPIIDVFGEQIGKLDLFRNVTIEKNYEETTLRNANTDFLTGLHNRRSLFSHLKAVDNCRQLSLMYVDLDNFKKVNDSFGHQKGDDALVLTSRIMTETFPHDYIARLGGDEFLIVISREMPKEELMQAGSTLLAALLDGYTCDKDFSLLSASVGIASEKKDKGGHDIELLLHNSDTALYSAKNSGKAKCVMFGGE